MRKLDMEIGMKQTFEAPIDIENASVFLKFNLQVCMRAFPSTIGRLRAYAMDLIRCQTYAAYACNFMPY